MKDLQTSRFHGRHGQSRCLPGEYLHFSSILLCFACAFYYTDSGLSENDTLFRSLNFRQRLRSAGAGIMSFLMYVRRQFIWWRLHPIGYLMHLSGASGQMWGSIFIGWFFKYLILKYGGIGGYRRFRPAFLGSVLGESLIGCVGYRRAVYGNRISHVTRLTSA